MHYAHRGCIRADFSARDQNSTCLPESLALCLSAMGLSALFRITVEGGRAITDVNSGYTQNPTADAPRIDWPAEGALLHYGARWCRQKPRRCAPDRAGGPGPTQAIPTSTSKPAATLLSGFLSAGLVWIRLAPGADIVRRRGSRSCRFCNTRCFQPEVRSRRCRFSPL
jgi:hypothetical protein